MAGDAELGALLFPANLCSSSDGPLNGPRSLPRSSPLHPDRPQADPRITPGVSTALLIAAVAAADDDDRAAQNLATLAGLSHPPFNTPLERQPQAFKGPDRPLEPCSRLLIDPTAI
ncbi:hypothetical protein OE88DRAFT_872889 [Heliocybe sulcata]|uniref:Uncharacterized protein n=1 Tax=Heliocybe sulcata TaxID=5364 RepID=A0A5C3MYM4_9AGAM|nr:hypothetical protein OE88DRAFT_872889 [Heliocybe sulcata]